MEKIKPDVYKDKTATLIQDFYTDDPSSFGALIKSGTRVFIKGNESDGTCFAEYLDFGFSIDVRHLNVN